MVNVISENELKKTLLIILVFMQLVGCNCNKGSIKPSATYVKKSKSIQALDGKGNMLWEHKTQYIVMDIAELSSGNVIVIDAGKGAGGHIKCLNPIDGIVLWKSEGRMWLVGIDASDNIFVNGGRPRSYYSRLYSPSGEILWEQNREFNNRQEALKKDADGNYVIQKREIQLISAVRQGNIEEVSSLIQSGAKVDVRDKGGMTPLHHAAKQANIEMVELLIKVGADVNLFDSIGRTPLDLLPLGNIIPSKSKRAAILAKSLMENGAKSSYELEPNVVSAIRTQWVNSEDNVISLRLSSNKKEYKTEESILLKIELKNISTKAVRIENIVYTLPGVGDGILIAGPKKIHYYGEMQEIHAWPIPIEPDQIIEEKVTIDTKTWIGTNVKGEYLISYEFRSLPTNTDKDLWNGALKTNNLLIIKK